MKIVPEEVCTDSSSVAIIDAEERTLGPLLALEVLRFWFHNVQNNGYTILVVISHDALICVRAISGYQPVSFVRKFGVLVVRKSFEFG